MGNKKEQATNLREEGHGRLPRERSSPENGVLKDEKDGMQDVERLGRARECRKCVESLVWVAQEAERRPYDIRKKF